MADESRKYSVNPFAAALMAGGDAISGIYGQRGNTYGNYLDALSKRQMMEAEAIKAQQAIEQQRFENTLNTNKFALDAQKAMAEERSTMLGKDFTPITRGQAQDIGRTQSPEALRQFMLNSARDSFGRRYAPPMTLDQKMANVSKQFGGNVPVGTTVYDKKTGTRVMMNRPLSEDEKASVSMVNYSTPKINRMIQLIDTGILDGVPGQKLAKQITVAKDGQLVVPDGSPLEELVGLANQIKVSGFALGGKNFTESEQKLIWGYLNPVGKSTKQYKKDINAANDILKGKANLTTGGMNEATRMMSDSNDSEDFASLWS